MALGEGICDVRVGADAAIDAGRTRMADAMFTDGGETASAVGTLGAHVGGA